MIRQTSMQAYIEIRHDGTLAEQQQMVHSCIVQFQPITNLEICEQTGININAVTGRCRELVKMKRVEQLDKTISPITGRKSIRWVSKT